MSRKFVEKKMGIKHVNKNNDINWNEKFQNLVAKGEDAHEELTELGNDFVACASKYGKIIISELYLNYKDKTIKPLTVGGLKNFIIFFYFFIIFNLMLTK